MDEDGGGVVRKRGWEGDVDADPVVICKLVHIYLHIPLPCR